MESIFHLNTPRSLKIKVIDKNYMEMCILNIMDAALCTKTDTLAMPVLGLDPYHDYTLNDVAEIMIYQIIEFCHL